MINVEKEFDRIGNLSHFRYKFKVACEQRDNENYIITIKAQDKLNPYNENKGYNVAFIRDRAISNEWLMMIETSINQLMNVIAENEDILKYRNKDVNNV